MGAEKLHEHLCPLCHSPAPADLLTSGDGRLCRSCAHCGLISVEREFLPTRQREKERYLKHDNGVEHEGHVRFLAQAVTPALGYLRAGMRGLDYGCGPVPTLSKMLAPHDLSCDDYDPLFFNKIPAKDYDFVFCTEVLEHLFDPGRDIRNIRSLLKPGGLWVIMTELWSDSENFKAWPYTRDLTHVCFYHAKTFDFICREFGFELVHGDGRRVIILRKNP